MKHKKPLPGTSPWSRRPLNPLRAVPTKPWLEVVERGTLPRIEPKTLADFLKVSVFTEAVFPLNIVEDAFKTAEYKESWTMVKSLNKNTEQIRINKEDQMSLVCIHYGSMFDLQGTLYDWSS